MKRTIYWVACVLIVCANVSLAEAVPSVDAKWMEATERLVTAGKRQVVTKKEARTVLVAQWAAKNGFSTTIAKQGDSYVLHLHKGIASR